MAKYTLLVAFLAVLVLFVAHTSATRWQEEEQSCKKQVQKLDLEHCEKYIMQRLRDREDEDEDVLTMRGIKYIRSRQSEDERSSSPKNKCCGQLSEVNILNCRCQAMQEIMDRVSDKCDKREMDDAERELWNLPLRCGIAPPLRCDLRPSDN